VVETEIEPAARRATDIDVDRAAGTMRIVWQDGHASDYRLATLRAQCPCAVCVGEMGRPGLVGEHTVFTPRQTTLADMTAVGRYALQPLWADGHTTGYFTFTRLRALCPCAECGARWRE